jgi:hypothetical protein
MGLERQHLIEVEERIRAGEERIDRQINLIEQLEMDGHDTREARKLLEIMKETLEVFRQERDICLEEFRHSERG